MVEIIAVEELDMSNVHSKKGSNYSFVTTIRLENVQNLKRICGQPLLFHGLNDAHM